MNVRVLADAEAEIETARQYLNLQVPGLGGLFIDDVSETFAAIADQPLRFAKLETAPDDTPYRRALLSIFRYAVVFEIVADEVVVIAVAHSSRAPNYCLRRRNSNR